MKVKRRPSYWSRPKKNGAQGRSLPHILCSATPVHGPGQLLDRFPVSPSPCTMESNPDWREIAKPWQGIDPIRSAEWAPLRTLASGDPPVGIIFDGARPHEKWCRGAESNHRHADFQSENLPYKLLILILFNNSRFA